MCKSNIDPLIDSVSFFFFKLEQEWLKVQLRYQLLNPNNKSKHTKMPQRSFLRKLPDQLLLLFSFPFQAEMVRSRNVECLSFPLTVMTVLTSTSWVLYGLEMNDCYIVV